MCREFPSFSMVSLRGVNFVGYGVFHTDYDLQCRQLKVYVVDLLGDKFMM